MQNQNGRLRRPGVRLKPSVGAESDMRTELPPSGLDPMRVLLARWKADPNTTYQSWFLWED